MKRRTPGNKERTSHEEKGSPFSPSSRVALLAVAAAGAKHATTRRSPGAGSTFVSPLVSAWTPALGSAFGYTIQYSRSAPAAASGDHEPHGRLRRLRRAADARSVQPPARAASRSRGRSSATSVDVQRPAARRATCSLDGPMIAKIYLGQITNWNDPAIKALNPGATLPNLKITPVYRSDGSGTTYNFTDYLSAVSPTWKSKVGVSTQPAFPAGIGAKGSSGVAGVVSQHGRRASATPTSPSRSRTTSRSRRSRTRPGSSSTRASVASRRPRRGVHEGAGEQRDAHREPAEVGADSRTRSAPTPT